MTYNILDESFIRIINGLSESTIYLIGDKDLITLWEDMHERKLMKGNAQAQNLKITGTKAKDLGVCRTANELKSKILATGNHLQNRKYLRNMIKQRKGVVVNARQQEEQMRKNDPNIKKGDVTSAIPHLLKKAQNEPLSKSDLRAMYIPTHKAIARTTDDTTEAEIEHEKTHHRNNEWLQSLKGGHTKANKLFAKSVKATAQAAAGNYKNYLHDPLEYNAMKAGGGDRNDKEEREVLTKAIHGKKTPEITKEIYAKQFKK